MSTEEKSLSTRDGFGTGLVAAAQELSAIVGLCADLTDSVKMRAFADAFPERFVELGVAEQNLAGVAAGMALAGKIPFAAGYGCFHPANSWGVIRSSIAYSNLNVKLVGGHTGLVTGEDGATHQSLEDIALMQVLPNMTVLVPADAAEAHEATLAAAKWHGPLYLRTNKYLVKPLTPLTSFELGKARLMRQGSDITVIAYGVMVSHALAVADELAKDHYSVRVLNMHTIKPLDTQSILQAAHETWGIFTLEDHQIIGGLGSVVSQVLTEKFLPQAKRPLLFHSFGVQDAFGQSGRADELLAEYELSVPHITHKLKSYLRSTHHMV